MLILSMLVTSADAYGFVSHAQDETPAEESVLQEEQSPAEAQSPGAEDAPVEGGIPSEEQAPAEVQTPAEERSGDTEQPLSEAETPAEAPSVPEVQSAPEVQPAPESQVPEEIIKHAEGIVGEAGERHLTDAEILEFYAEQVCMLTEIGRADGFQYLCDLTTFSSESIKVFTVTGERSVDQGSFEPHTWNILRMEDDRFYPADPGVLFLKGYHEIIEDENGPYGYRYRLEKKEGEDAPIIFLTYLFDEASMRSLTSAERSLSAKDYVTETEERAEAEQIAPKADNALLTGSPEAQENEELSSESISLPEANLVPDLSALRASAADVVYTGKAGQFKSTIVITDANGAVLKRGTDYDTGVLYYYAEDTELDNLTKRYSGQTVQQTDLVPAGTVLRVVAFGKGKYTGAISAYYRIVSADISKATVRIDPQYYTGSEICPDKSMITVIHAGRVLNDRDYEIVSYTNNINKGTAKLTIRGVGAYGREKTAGFTIMERSLYYNISFHGNGATSGGPARMQLASGKTYSLNANNFKRTGFVFDGWNSEPDGTGTPYADREKITPSPDHEGGVLHLYAQWTPISYEIRYHLNGGPNHPSNTHASYTAESGDIEIYAPEKEDWPAGYQFAGWYSDAAFKTRFLTVREGSSGHIDLYAKWVPYTYTVSFDGNGATKGTMANQVLSFGARQALRKNAYTRTGHVFLGWSTDPDARAAEYVNAGTVSDLIPPVSDYRSGITLYAVWRDSFSIRYEINDEPSSPAVFDETTPGYIDNYTYGKICALPVPVRQGYAFAGWYRDDNTFKKRVNRIEKTTTGDLTLYAKWTPNTYTVVFDGNGKTGGSMANLNVSFERGATLRNNTYSRRGYAFAGWALSKEDAAAGNRAYENLDVPDWSYFLPLKNKSVVRLYAIWEPAPYQISYVTNRGVLEGDYLREYRYNSDTMSFPLALPVPIREGYTFGGWYRDAAFKTRINSIAKTQAENLTLYAKWTAPYTCSEFVLELYTMGGSLQHDGEADEGGLFETTYPNGGGVPKDRLASFAPVRDGYTFAGWYREKTYKTLVRELSVKTTGDVALYAKWTPKRFTVSFDANLPHETDGAGEITIRRTLSGRMNNQSFNYGKTGALTKNAFSVKGFTFKGWALTKEEADAGIVTYADRQVLDGTVFSFDGNLQQGLTLYAVWEKTGYTITYANLMPGAVNHNAENYTVDDAFTLKDAEMIGNVFLGWYADRGFTKRVTGITRGTTGNRTLYARWRTDTYTIHYELNGGRLLNMAKGYTETYMKRGNMYYILPEAAREGYRFDGWYKDRSLKTKVTEVSANTGINLTLYARWTKLSPLVQSDQAAQDAAQFFTEFPVTSEVSVPWKKVVCFGDMLTVGVQGGKSRNWGVETTSYPGVVASYYGSSVTVVNAGASDGVVNSKAFNPFTRIVREHAWEHGDADAVFFMAGTSDWLEYSSTDFFAGDYRMTCETIRSCYPSADVFVILPPEGNFYFTWTLASLRDHVYSVAREFGFYVIDLPGQGILNARDDATRKKYYSSNFHLNNAGYRLLGTVIAARALEMAQLGAGGIVVDAQGTQIVSGGGINQRYTGFFTDGDTTYYVRNGRVALDVTGVICAAASQSDQSTQWRYVRNGIVDTGYTGMAEGLYGWYYVVNGSVDFDRTGIEKEGDSTWIVREGRGVSSYTGAFSDGTGLWYAQEGSVEDLSASVSGNHTNVLDHGATPDDASDDTAALNDAVNATPDGGVVYIPAGEYRVDASVGVKVNGREGLTILMDPDTVLRVIPNHYSGYNAIDISYSAEISVTGGQVVGERYTHSFGNEWHEWGMGISVYSCSNVSISGVTIRDCMGDGIYLGIRTPLSRPNDGITIRGCLLTNNRRNNLSIVAADNVTVENCTISAANGTSPQWGIDIEPNRINGEIRPNRNITIIGTNIYAYQGISGYQYGEFMTAGSAWMKATSAENVIIHDCYFDGDFANYSAKKMRISDTVITGIFYRKQNTVLSNVTYRKLNTYCFGL
ncbi:MAG: InlB B-repeat-containing protein [Lachnospiraceae bacterium]|nr:InlB B-repeat-containing protein [Lachnospiraceae bacterium]